MLQDAQVCYPGRHHLAGGFMIDCFWVQFEPQVAGSEYEVLCVRSGGGFKRMFHY